MIYVSRCLFPILLIFVIIMITQPRDFRTHAQQDQCIATLGCKHMRVTQPQCGEGTYTSDIREYILTTEVRNCDGIKIGHTAMSWYRVLRPGQRKLLHLCQDKLFCIVTLASDVAEQKFVIFFESFYSAQTTELRIRLRKVESGLDSITGQAVVDVTASPTDLVPLSGMVSILDLVNVTKAEPVSLTNTIAEEIQHIQMLKNDTNLSDNVTSHIPDVDAVVKVVNEEKRIADAQLDSALIDNKNKMEKIVADIESLRFQEISPLDDSESLVTGHLINNETAAPSDSSLIDADKDDSKFINDTEFDEAQQGLDKAIVNLNRLQLTPIEMVALDDEHSSDTEEDLLVKGAIDAALNAAALEDPIVVLLNQLDKNGHASKHTNLINGRDFKKSLSSSSDASVLTDNRDFIAINGTAKHKLEPAKVQTLKEVMANVNFQEIQQRPTISTTPVPTNTLTSTRQTTTAVLIAAPTTTISATTTTVAPMTMTTTVAPRATTTTLRPIFSQKYQKYFLRKFERKLDRILSKVYSRLDNSDLELTKTSDLLLRHLQKSISSKHRAKPKPTIEPVIDLLKSLSKEILLRRRLSHRARSQLNKFVISTDGWQKVSQSMKDALRDEKKKKGALTAEWSSWSDWSKCSVTCGPYNSGQVFRTRSCNGNSLSLCKQSEKYFQAQQCTPSLPKCNLNKMWSAWSHWTPCSVTCSLTGTKNGAGYRQKSRVCRNRDNGKEMKGCSGQSFVQEYCGHTVPCGATFVGKISPVDPDDAGHRRLRCSYKSELNPVNVHWIVPDGDELSAFVDHPRYLVTDNELTVLKEDAGSGTVEGFQCLVVSDFNKRQRLQEEIKAALEACMSNPCLNGGICSEVTDIDSYLPFQCHCSVGHYGTFCQRGIGPVAIAAIVILFLALLLALLCLSVWCRNRGYRLEFGRNGKWAPKIMVKDLPGESSFSLLSPRNGFGLFATRNDAKGSSYPNQKNRRIPNTSSLSSLKDFLRTHFRRPRKDYARSDYSTTSPVLSPIRPSCSVVSNDDSLVEVSRSEFKQFERLARDRYDASYSLDLPSPDSSPDDSMSPPSNRSSDLRNRMIGLNRKGLNASYSEECGGLLLANRTSPKTVQFLEPSGASAVLHASSSPSKHTDSLHGRCYADEGTEGIMCDFTPKTIVQEVDRHTVSEPSAVNPQIYPPVKAFSPSKYLINRHCGAISAQNQASSAYPQSYAASLYSNDILPDSQCFDDQYAEGISCDLTTHSADQIVDMQASRSMISVENQNDYFHPNGPSPNVTPTAARQCFDKQYTDAINCDLTARTADQQVDRQASGSMINAENLSEYFHINRPSPKPHNLATGQCFNNQYGTEEIDCDLTAQPASQIAAEHLNEYYYMTRPSRISTNTESINCDLRRQDTGEASESYSVYADNASQNMNRHAQVGDGSPGRQSTNTSHSQFVYDLDNSTSTQEMVNQSSPGNNLSALRLNAYSPLRSADIANGPSYSVPSYQNICEDLPRQMTAGHGGQSASDLQNQHLNTYALAEFWIPAFERSSNQLSDMLVKRDLEPQREHVTVMQIPKSPVRQLSDSPAGLTVFQPSAHLRQSPVIFNQMDPPRMSPQLNPVLLLHGTRVMKSDQTDTLPNQSQTVSNDKLYVIPSQTLIEHGEVERLEKDPSPSNRSSGTNPDQKYRSMVLHTGASQKPLPVSTYVASRHGAFENVSPTGIMRWNTSPGIDKRMTPRTRRVLFADEQPEYSQIAEGSEHLTATSSYLAHQYIRNNGDINERPVRLLTNNTHVPNTSDIGNNISEIANAMNRITYQSSSPVRDMDIYPDHLSPRKDFLPLQVPVLQATNTETRNETAAIFNYAPASTLPIRHLSPSMHSKYVTVDDRNKTMTLPTVTEQRFMPITEAIAPVKHSVDLYHRSDVITLSPPTVHSSQGNVERHLNEDRDNQSLIDTYDTDDASWSNDRNIDDIATILANSTGNLVFSEQGFSATIAADESRSTVLESDNAGSVIMTEDLDFITSNRTSGTRSADQSEWNNSNVSSPENMHTQFIGLEYLNRDLKEMDGYDRAVLTNNVDEGYSDVNSDSESIRLEMQTIWTPKN